MVEDTHLVAQTALNMLCSYGRIGDFKNSHQGKHHIALKPVYWTGLHYCKTF